MFATKSFFIKYCEEEIMLNSIANFRVEVEVKPEYESSPFFIESELVFGDVEGEFDSLPEVVS